MQHLMCDINYGDDNINIIANSW